MTPRSKTPQPRLRRSSETWLCAPVKRPARHPSSPLSLRCRKTCPVGREELEDCRTPLSLRASNLQPFISSLRSHRERRWVIQSNIGGTPVSQKRFARTIKAVSGGSQLLRCAPQPPAHRPCPSAPAGQDCGRPPLALRKSTDLLSDFRTASAVSRPAASRPPCEASSGACGSCGLPAAHGSRLAAVAAHRASCSVYDCSGGSSRG